MLNPDVVLFGVTIAEPVTTLTDLISGGVCLLAYRRLRSAFGDDDREIFLFGEFFFYLGAATVLSGIFGHALRLRVPDGVRMIAWSFSGVGVLFAERATNVAVARGRVPRAGRLLDAVPWIQLALFLTLLWIRRTFLVVVTNLIAALIVYVLPLQVGLVRDVGRRGADGRSTNRQRTGEDAGRRRIAAGILLGLLPAFVYIREIGVSAWFNHHDISHLMVAGVAYVMFRGVYAVGVARGVGRSAGTV